MIFVVQLDDGAADCPLDIVVEASEAEVDRLVREYSRTFHMAGRRVHHSASARPYPGHMTIHEARRAAGLKRE